MKKEKEKKEVNLNFTTKEEVLYMIFEAIVLFILPYVEFHFCNKLLYIVAEKIDQIDNIARSIVAYSAFSILIAAFVVYVIYAFLTRLLFFPPIDRDYKKSLSLRIPEEKFKLEMYCSDIWGKARLNIDKNSNFYITGWQIDSEVKLFLRRCLAFLIWPFWFIKIRKMVKRQW